MDHQNQIIYLSNEQENRLVKKLALFTFRKVRAISTQLIEAPSQISQISIDLRDAWRESAIPKA